MITTPIWRHRFKATKASKLHRGPTTLGRCFHQPRKLAIDSKIFINSFNANIEAPTLP